MKNEMSDVQRLADAMLAAAGTVLGRLVERQAAVGESVRTESVEPIQLDGSELVALVELPSIGAKIVVRFPANDMRSVVSIMFGGAEDLGEMGPMQLSIVSETVSQIAVAMAEALAGELKVSLDAVHVELCTDAGLLPPPPFESYVSIVRISAALAPHLSIDFATATKAKLGCPPEPEPVELAADVPAQDVPYAAMQPTPVRAAPLGEANLDLVHDVSLRISAVLGKSVMPLREVVSLQSGSVFELDKLAADPVDLYANNVLIARGEVVVVDDKYAVRISELNQQAE
jgi:flagellar motor switch protein FliN